ncbi:hypothetical protein EMCG_00802 [[Emmonsia] crescens]|uniref:BTB domain-containing protein n=1 Tax=[Emmonsia] crescens TaxID=73230 RepID=A0A0G2HPH3_9EURO|nr:hypothetical protein EMCG_00802 [Emmonsia crescens UAMH 3008]
MKKGKKGKKAEDPSSLEVAATHQDSETAASDSYNTEIPTVSTTNGTDALFPPSPYETEIVRVLVGPISDQRVFLVHLGILDQSPSLRSRMHPTATVGEHHSISLVDTDPVVFELILRFLYTGKYQKCPYPSQIFPTSEQDDTNKWSGADKAFELHSLLYCFAREYEMDELSALVQTNIENMTQVPYRNVLDVAKHAYPKLPQNDDDDAYREKFRHETRVAMKENKNITRESWVLDVFWSEHGNLTVDLFTTLTEPLRCDGEAINGEKSPLEEPFSPPQTNKGKEKMVDWGADYCIQEPATVSEVEEPAFHSPEETIAVVPEAEYEKCPEPLDPEPESEPEQEPEEPVEEPAANVEPAVCDNWAACGSKKKGKKGNKIVEEIVPSLPEPDLDSWGTFIAPEKKKKGKKGKKIVEEIVPPSPEESPPPATEDLPAEESCPPEEAPVDDYYQVEEEQPPPEIPPPAQEPAEEEPTTPQSPSSTFMLGDTGSQIMKERYFIPRCSRRKLHMSSENYWMDCVRCRKELGDVARGIVEGDDGVEGEREDERVGEAREGRDGFAC